MTPSQEQKLRHMLGAEPGRYLKKQWGFRNYYASAPAGQAFQELEEMEKQGLVSKGRATETLVYFHATEEGCTAVGMTKTQIKRAMGS